MPGTYLVRTKKMLALAYTDVLQAFSPGGRNFRVGSLGHLRSEGVFLLDLKLE